MSARPRQPLRRIFAIPVLVAASSLVGLVAALVGDGVWDVLSSACLAIPAVILAVCVARKPRQNAS